MRCPFCGHEETQVKDSRPTEDNTAIRRRRFCPGCGARFTTFERVQLRELVVVKSNGQREPFDREKLLRSMQISLRKRPVDQDRLERVVNGIVRRLESSGETEIPTTHRPRTRGISKYGFARFAKGFLDLLTIVTLTRFRWRPQHLIGVVEGLPPDFARNHDHYLHGAPKQE